MTPYQVNHAEDLAHLRAALAERRKAMHSVEADVLELRAELDEFGQVYATRCGAAQARLETLEAELAARRARYGQEAGGAAFFAQGYASVGDQYQRAWTRPTEPSAALPGLVDAGPEGRDELRTLYRELARMHHPDLAREPEERAARTRTMAVINAAYAAEALDDLRALAGRIPREPDGTDDERRAWLRAEIVRVEGILRAYEDELQTLEQGSLMRLKLSVSLGRTRGQDVLGEVAQWIEARTAACLAELRGK